MLNIKLTHQDIANLIASTRETVTVTLNHLKADEVINTMDKYIIIKDIDKLKKVAQN